MKSFYKKKILITGHTGFKGSWLTQWLLKHKANVVGISRNIPTKPSHYKILKLSDQIKEYFFRIEDRKKIEKVILKEKPEFIFHLAAQAIIKNSYSNPNDTWQSNTFGTLNLLESLRKVRKKTYVVIITSDKVYKNLEIKRGYKENDILGGDDPYSASKGSTEILINSYIKSFFSKEKKNISISVARAGNVVGGGDWSNYRLIPDCIKSCIKNKKLLIRNPKSTRPWQHVMELVYGYMTLAILLKKKRKLHGEAFNFGPSQAKNYNVISLVKLMKKYWTQISWRTIQGSKKNFYESNLLKLNCSKAKEKLKWRCILTFPETVSMVTDWYKLYYSGSKKIQEFSLNQIKKYETLLKSRPIK